MRRGRERTRAVAAHVGAHKEELLKQIPEGKVFKGRSAKRNEVLRLGRIKFNDLPTEEQAPYIVSEPKSQAFRQKKGKGYGSKAVPKTPSPPNAAQGVPVQKSPLMLTPSRASKSREGVRVSQPPQGGPNIDGVQEGPARVRESSEGHG